MSSVSVTKILYLFNYKQRNLISLQNLDDIGAASRATALQHELVQRTMTQFNDHNFEELDGVYTRPTLDLYLLNKYWAFLTNGAAKEEIADLENARNQL